MTQKTGRGKPAGPPPKNDTWKTGDGEEVIDASKAGEDLGLRPGEAFEPDPTGFEPSSEQVEEHGGRGMIPLSGEDLAKLHQAHAPDQSMVPDPFKDLSDRPIRERSEAYGDEDNTMNEDASRAALRKRRAAAEASPEQVAGELMDEFNPEGFQQTVGTPPPRRPSPAPSSQEDDQGPPVDVDVDSLEEAAGVIEALIKRANQARDEGDLRMASELTGMAQRIIAGNHLQRQQEEKPRHPALKKLLNNLGLQKIEHKDVPWLGSTWRFAPRPAPMDYWLGANTGPEGLELNAAIVAAGLVGLDDEEGVMHPIWEVHNIALTAEYVFELPNDNPDLPPLQDKVRIPIYRKVCESCSCDVRLDQEACQVCGAVLDPYDMPLDLRMRCAQVTFVLLTEKLCLDAPDLGYLVDEYRKVMPDRRFDKEEVFPFVKSLPKQPETQS